MAIKGKGKTRGGRTIATPPRPVLVVRKPPLYRRPWVIGLVGAVAVAGILFAVFSSIGTAHRKARIKDEQNAVGEFTRVLGGFMPAGQAQAEGSDVLLYPTFSADLDKLKNGQIDAKTALATATNFSAQAKTSADDISAVKTTSLISATFDVSETSLRAPGLTQLTLVEAQYLIAQSFRTWQSAFDLWGQAAGATGAERATLVDQAKQLGSVAQDLFGHGWSELTQIRFQLGIAQPVQLQPAQPGQLTPTPSPSPISSPTASAKPKSSPSK